MDGSTVEIALIVIGGILVLSFARKLGRILFFIALALALFYLFK